MPVVRRSIIEPSFAPASRGISATEVSENLLEATRQAYLNRAFEEFRACIRLPLTLGTFEGQQRLVTQDDLRRVFEQMCAFMDQNGVIDMSRRTIAADYVAADTIHSTFVSKYVLPGFAMSDEVIVQSTLKYHDGRWYVTDGDYATQITGITRALRLSERR